MSRLCTLMGVRLVRVRREFDWEEALPEDAHVHPNLFLAFSQTARCVYYAEPKRTALLYLPHEVIHVVWPTVPWDPEIEWLEGLLPYEMAWLDRLCRTSTERECFKCWSRYADEGRDAVADFDFVLGDGGSSAHGRLLQPPRPMGSGLKRVVV